MIDFIISETGFYFMTLIAAIGAGLIPTASSGRGKTAIVLVTVVSLVAALAYSTVAPWAALIYVLSFSIIRILTELNELSTSPLLINEPYWRKVVLLTIHQRAVRLAAAQGVRETV